MTNNRMIKTQLPKRKSIRLKKYHYSKSGMYYVTICTQDRKCIFGNVHNNDIQLNDVGKMINRWFSEIPNRFNDIELDVYQIMPNHMHAIIVNNGLTHNGQTHRFAPTKSSSIAVGVDQCVDPNDKPPTLGKIIQWLKTMTTNEYIRSVKNNGWKPFNKHLWQRNYWEHIIRSDSNLIKIRRYIKNNPLMWHRDRNNPKHIRLKSVKLINDVLIPRNTY